MKKQYIHAEIEVFMFQEKQVVLASAVAEPTEDEHDNAFLGFDEL